MTSDEAAMTTVAGGWMLPRRTPRAHRARYVYEQLAPVDVMLEVLAALHN
ncbi:hypothetical protein ACWDSJ_02920 [Nocardia sp. NPDC003482]